MVQMITPGRRHHDLSSTVLEQVRYQTGNALGARFVLNQAGHEARIHNFPL